jgi:hypothetical protein
MSRPALCFLMALGLAFPVMLLAEEAVEAEPGLPPVPRITPLIPAMDEGNNLSAEESLLRQLKQAVSSRDQQISQIMDRVEGDLPDTGSAPLETLEPEQQTTIVDDREKRDQAWRNLGAALAAISEEQRQPSDVLDTPAVQADSFQVNSLRAETYLKMVRSYKGLLEDQENPERDEFVKAFAIVNDIAIDYLSHHQQPQHRYLQFWFARELALRSEGPEQQRFSELARTAHTQLTNNWAGSVSLILTANTLLEEMDLRLQANATP